METEKLREQIKNQLDHLPEEVLREAYDFLLFIEQKHKKEMESLPEFGLNYKAFDFWLNENETDYTKEDIKYYRED